MAIGTTRILGLAVDDRSALAAELRVNGNGARLVRAAEFAYPDGLSLDDPEPLGRALQAFLHENRLSARRVVLGVPGRWLMVKPKRVPPADAEALAGLLRLEAERDFSTDLADLAVDYVLGPESDAQRSVLLLAMLRRRVDQLVSLARASRLTPLAVTPSSLALGAGSPPAAGPRLLLHLTPRYADLVGQDGERVDTLAHLATPVGAGVGPDLANEVRRIAFSMASVDELVVWDGAGLGPDLCRELGDALSMPVRPAGGVSALAISAPAGGSPDSDRFAAPAALALLGVKAGALPLDFLHSRLTPPKPSGLGKRAVWAAVVGGALAAAAALFVAEWREQEQGVAALEDRLAAMRPDIEAARAVVDKVSLARAWTDRRPGFLDYVRELTLAFPPDGRIWATSLSVREGGKAVVSGRATGEAAVLAVLDRLKGAPAVGAVKLLYMRENAGDARYVSFAISLVFAG